MQEIDRQEELQEERMDIKWDVIELCKEKSTTIYGIKYQLKNDTLRKKLC